MTPQIIFSGLIILFLGYAIFDVWGLNQLGRVFPLWTCMVTLLFAGALGRFRYWPLTTVHWLLLALGLILLTGLGIGLSFVKVTALLLAA